MIGNKKVFLSALAFIMAGCVSVPSARAADDLVLFKIHDVESVKNNDDLVTSCSFGVTFYNRSPYTLKSVKLNLGWEDESIVNTIAKEKNESSRKGNRKYSATEAKTSAVVSTVVGLYNLAPQSQKTIRAKLDSDRCFLLMNDLTYDASECSVTAAEGVENPYLGNEKCTSFFEFVSSNNPEYYREFKAISYSEEKANESEARSKDRSEINQLYEDTLAEFNKVKTALSGIKGDVNPDDIAAAQSDTAAPDTSAKQNIEDKLQRLFPADASSAKTSDKAAVPASSALEKGSVQNPFDGTASASSAAEPEADKNLAAATQNITSSTVAPVESVPVANEVSNGGNASTSVGGISSTHGGGTVSNGSSLGHASNNTGSGNGNFGSADNVSGIIGNGIFNDDVDVSYENVGYEGKTYERPSSNEKPYVVTKDKMIYNSPNAI